MTLIHCLLMTLSFNLVLGLKLTFRPSELLTDLASKKGYELYDVLTTAFRNPDMWPILEAFSQARFFNFMSTFPAALVKYDCKTILKTFQTEGFPTDKLLKPDLITSSSVSICFAQLSPQVFPESPLNSTHYNPKTWGPNHHLTFIKDAFDSSDKDAHFHSFWHPEKITSAFFRPFAAEWQKWAWQTLSVFAIKMTFSELYPEILSALDPKPDLIAFRSTNSSSNGFPSVLKTMFSKPDSTEIEFAQTQIMRIVTLSSVLIIFTEKEEPRIQTLKIILDHLSDLSVKSAPKFPMQRELKRYIKFLTGDNLMNADSFAEFSQLLIVLINFCHGMAHGVWFYTVFYIWNRIRSQNHFKDADVISAFMINFSKTFFSPLASATIEDICLFFRCINSYFSVPTDDYFYSDRIFNIHLLNKPELSQQIVRKCWDCLNPYRIRNSHLFPTRMRIESVFQEVRVIQNFNPQTQLFNCDNRPEAILLSALKHVNEQIDSTVDPYNALPLNSIIKNCYGVFLNGGLPAFIYLVFKSMLNVKKWFPVIRYKSTIDKRPVIIPSLSFPTQLIEIIGFMIGKAVINGIKVPFLFDFRYFSLFYLFGEDNLNSDSENQNRLTEFIANAYPSINEQAYSVIWALNYSIKNIFDNFDLNSFNLKSSNNSSFVYNYSIEIRRLLLMGSARLRIGLEKAFPVELLKATEVYDFIFK